MDWVRYAIAAAALAVPVVLALQVWRGRVKVNNCCAPANPERDLRMRAD